MRHFLPTVALCLALVGAVRGGEGATHSGPVDRQPVKRSYLQQGWLIQETESFQVICRPDLGTARRLPEICEALKGQLQETWLGESEANWSPRCVIVVHPTVAGYVRELGVESRSSSGCASLAFERGRVSKRRIDLRSDAEDWLSTALPHELAHVVLAPQFSGGKVPRWADEGMAILAEPAARQIVRRQAMQRALASHARYNAADLMAQADYPTGVRRDAFYGQSVSLVAHLVERDSPARFLEFLKLSQSVGNEQALRTTYQIGSLAELNTRWQPRLLERGPSVELIADRVARITEGKSIID